MTDEETLKTVLDILAPFAKARIPIESDTEILELALIDSAAMVSILLELERRLSIQIQASDLTFDHFQTPRILAKRFAANRNG